MTHSALNCTDTGTQAPDHLEVLYSAFRRFLQEARPEGALPVLLPLLGVFSSDLKGWNQSYLFAVLCFSCDLWSWHPGTVRQSLSDHRGREGLTPGGKGKTTQEALKKRKKKEKPTQLSPGRLLFKA